jgi:hypothetical protein
MEIDKYHNGKIYKLVCEITGEQYIGSTCQRLSKRLHDHVQYVKGGNRKYSSHGIIERGQYKICLIENYKCDSKLELEKRERYFVETMDCINKNIPTRTPVEYRKANKEKIKNFNDLYYKENSDKIKARVKRYREANPEVIKARKKAYAEKNKEKIAAKMALTYTCKCGSTLTICKKNRHERTKAHIAYCNK